MSRFCWGRGVIRRIEGREGVSELGEGVERNGILDVRGCGGWGLVDLGYGGDGRGFWMVTGALALEDRIEDPIGR